MRLNQCLTPPYTAAAMIINGEQSLYSLQRIFRSSYWQHQGKINTILTGLIA